jgi:hypothetical protein
MLQQVLGGGALAGQRQRLNLQSRQRGDKLLVEPVAHVVRLCLLHVSP